MDLKNQRKKEFSLLERKRLTPSFFLSEQIRESSTKKTKNIFKKTDKIFCKT
jgi:hypothetical protein